MKKKANALNIRKNRIAIVAGFSNIDETIQGEIVNIIIKDQNNIEEVRNKKEKFGQLVTIPINTTLKGEIKDKNGETKKKYKILGN